MDLYQIDRDKNLQRQMEQIVAKSNELITQTRSKMSLRETRLLLYMISKIKPSDPPETTYEISVSDFSKVCGLTAKPKYTAIKEVVIGMNRTFWLDNFEGKGKHRMFVWFDTALYNEGSGTISFEFSRKLHPFLFALKNRYTSYPLYYILPMRSQYSIKLYELLKCYKDREPERPYFPFYLEDLRKTLGAEHYVKWLNFRQKVLDPAVGMLNSTTPSSGEINIYSDLKASYRIEKQGRAVHMVIFHVEKKTKAELEMLKTENQDILFGDILRPDTKPEQQLPGQVSMENMLDKRDLLGSEDGV